MPCEIRALRSFAHRDERVHQFLLLGSAESSRIGEEDGNRLLVILVLLLGLDRGLCDTVQITLAGLGDAATTLLLVLLEDTNLLESLEDLAVDGAGGVGVVRGPRTAVLDTTVDFPETADTDGLAHVDVAGDGGGADVEPDGGCQHGRFSPNAKGVCGDFELTSRWTEEGAPWHGWS